MLDKVDFKERGVLTWNEAFNNADISVAELLEFSETPEEETAIFNAGMSGTEAYIDKYL